MIRTEGLILKLVQCILNNIECTHSDYYSNNSKQCSGISYKLLNEVAVHEEINKLIDAALLHT